MTDSPPPSPDGRTTPPKAPRWVKVSAIVLGVLVLLVVILKLTGLGGEHGPGRHMGAAGTPAGVTQAQQVEAGHR
ncbi:hypothetical protein AMK26_18425 [Streptomyces sp. CB03234]|uniref:hypothetical protein n=1 Tax=Streptomyces sp. (strain CB03234) TaxID=1703937 RepID=UPI000938E2B7|nr:hypothetical protein [Streptomyces sp. CB03234]OKK03470.1 hypothetical protein AMK26_18425 [Streptomyces sp. CB03234]